MTDLSIDIGDARKIAGLHDDGATTIENTASSAPSGINGGIASGLLGSILGKIAGDAADLASVEHATGALMNQIVDNVVTTDEAASSRFDRLGATFEDEK